MMIYDYKNLRIYAAIICDNGRAYFTILMFDNFRQSVAVFLRSYHGSQWSVDSCLGNPSLNLLLSFPMASLFYNLLQTSQKESL